MDASFKPCCAVYWYVVSSPNTVVSCDCCAAAATREHVTQLPPDEPTRGKLGEPRHLSHPSHPCPPLQCNLRGCTFESPTPICAQTHCVRSPMVLLRGSTTLQTSSFTSTVTLCFSLHLLHSAQQHQAKEWGQLGSGSATPSSRAKHRVHSSPQACQQSVLFWPTYSSMYPDRDFRVERQREGLGVSTTNKREHNQKSGTHC